MNDENIKLIQIIGEQWKFLLVSFFILVFLFKWKTIWSLVNNFTQIKVKRGENEIELHREVKVIEKNIELELEQQKIDPDVETTEEEKAELDSSETESNIDAQYFMALSEKKFSDAKILFEKSIEDEKNPVTLNEKKVRNFYWRFYNGDTNAIEEFEKYISNLPNDNEQISYALYFMGIFYKDSNNYEKAIELTKKALSLTNLDEHKASCINKLSTLYYDNSEKEKSIQILLENIVLINERNPKSSIYRSIAEFYKKTENKLFESVAYQKALELNPNNTYLLFDSAYNYSETKSNLSDLGLLLYKKILTFNSKHQGALNNAGVAYQNLNLKFKSVQYYKKSIETEHSLAASNLAYLLIDKGFEQEALSYLEKAKTYKDVHENVFTATSKLKNEIKEETELEEKILEIAKKKYLFFNHFGSAIFSIDLIKIDVSVNWSYDEKKLSITIDDNFINIKWEVGEEKHRIYGTITNNGITAHYEKPKKNIYSYSEDTKYTYNYFDGFGYFSSEKEIHFIFEIEKEINEFKMEKK